MKIIFVLDQIQAGLGGKEHGDQELGGRRGALGSVEMFGKLLKEREIEVLATIYCGDSYYLNEPQENALKIAAMSKKLGADVVLCGPCFNYAGFALMAAEVAAVIEERAGIPAVAAMSKECEEVITKYKTVVDIVKMPKKGGTGLTEAMAQMITLCEMKVAGENIEEFVANYCY